jgi:hypothetical protein
MKIIRIFILTIVLSSCCTKKNKSNLSPSQIATSCPNNGDCSLEIIENKSVLTNMDTGKLNYALVDSFDKTVVRYQYKKDMDQSNVDGGYREEIVFEIEADSNVIKLENNNLKQTKMLYGRYCFCRGQTGLYEVVNGSLNLKNKDELGFDLSFKIDEVPQIVTHIEVVNGKLKQ